MVKMILLHSPVIIIITMSVVPQIHVKTAVPVKSPAKMKMTMFVCLQQVDLLLAKIANGKLSFNVQQIEVSEFQSQLVPLLRQGFNLN